ncbi:MAG: DEAD/DEAH box helicase family protein [Planctomycetes bacterium]|nr:DEAD/DEAH box helicase family protein [Planctomycetota bacterium]
MSERRFQVVSEFEPTGDQPAAIDQLTANILAGKQHVCLLGATGTGKTFTMAHVIARLQKPTLILSHNKTLAAQLYEELRDFFPNNSVNYFVSYYDYYQPEAYIPQRDIYIEKDSSRNDDLDQLRLAATSNILSRRDTVVVASVSCIFGLGSPRAYGERVLTITKGSLVDRRAFLLALSAMQYQRTDMEWKRGQFRVRGDAIDIWPAYEKYAVHVELFGSEVDSISLINPTSGEELAREKQFFLFPAVHYVMPEDQMQTALSAIRAELEARVLELRSAGKLLEAQRLISRTKFDLELLEETGTCPGIENYSRFMDGRSPGERPYCLMDYFDFAPPADGPAQFTAAPAVGPESLAARSEAGFRGYRSVDTDRMANETLPRPNQSDWLLIIDESHVTLPQVRAMFNGDRARKTVLVDHGFRLPSALDNRPLRFEEFESVVPRTMYVSATPGPYELEKAGGEVAEQVIRPTGLLDPEVEIKPTKGQVQDLLERCQQRVKDGERVLVTALTKRLCEDLANYLAEKGLSVRYLHSDIETLDRVEILADLRRGNFDVLVGVNLLREGLDLPEVSLVAILDADKEGFLRSPTSLIQLMGRAARNVNGRVIMYADTMTPAMSNAIGETERRRVKQTAYNLANGITPQTIKKAIRHGLEVELRARKTARDAVATNEPEFEIDELVRTMEEEMLAAAQSMEFEKAAVLRDQITKLRQRKAAATERGAPTKARRSDLEGGSTKRKREGKAGMPGTRMGKRRKG